MTDSEPTPLPAADATARQAFLRKTEERVIALCLGADPRRAMEACLAAGLAAPDFDQQGLGEVFTLMAELFADGVDYEALVVADEAVKRGIVREAQAEAYTDWLVRLGYDTGEEYRGSVAPLARVLVGAARRRQITREVRELAEQAQDATVSLEEFTEQAMARVAAWRPDTERRGLRLVTHTDWVRFSEPDDVTGYVFTGWPEVDRETLGFAPGNLVVIGGVTGGGKTMTAINIAKQAAMFDGHPVAFFSAEMTAKETGRRVLASLSGVPTKLFKVRGQQISEQDARRVVSALTGLSGAKPQFYIDDMANPTLQHIASQVLTLKRAVPTLAVVVVDFLQLVRIEDRSLPHHERLTRVAYFLKGLAKEAQVVVFAPAQANHKNKDADWEPGYEDLQGSSGMAQAADFVFLSHLLESTDGSPTKLKLICDKNREGFKFSVLLGWRPVSATVYSLEEAAYA